MMPITKEEVMHVAKLAQLKLSETELEQYQQEMSTLLDHFKEINEIDTEGIEPKPHAVAMSNVFGEDVVEPYLSREQALSNAPSSRAGLFMVSTIIEE